MHGVSRHSYRFGVYEGIIKFHTLSSIMLGLKAVYFSVLGIALLASLLSFKDRRYILFIPLMALILGVEVIREIVDERLDSYVLLALAIGEYTFLSLIIRNFIYSPLKRKVILVSIFIMVPVFIVVQLTIGQQASYKYLNQMIESPLICAWTVLYLFETARHDEEFEIFSHPMFWISLGNLLFYSGSLFSYGFGSLLTAKQRDDAAQTVFMIARILNILLYLLYFIGFLCILRKRNLSLSQR